MADLSQIKICSFNASGLRVDKKKFLSIMNFMKTNKMDIVLLQETHLVKEDMNYIKKFGRANFI